MQVRRLERRKDGLFSRERKECLILRQNSAACSGGGILRQRGGGGRGKKSGCAEEGKKLGLERGEI